MYGRKEPLKVQIESAGQWSESNKELFIELVAEAIALYLNDPANREAMKRNKQEGSLDQNE